MLLSDLASFPKGIIKMVSEYFVCIFGGIKSALMSSCDLSKKTNPPIFDFCMLKAQRSKTVAIACEGLFKTTWPARCFVCCSQLWHG